MLWLSWSSWLIGAKKGMSWLFLCAHFVAHVIHGEIIHFGNLAETKMLPFWF